MFACKNDLNSNRFGPISGLFKFFILITCLVVQQLLYRIDYLLSGQVATGGQLAPKNRNYSDIALFISFRYFTHMCIACSMLLDNVKTGTFTYEDIL